MTSSKGSGSIGRVLRIAALGSLGVSALWANPAVTRHYWNFEGAEPYRDQVGTAHAEITGQTTVLLEPGHDDSGQSMRTRALVSGVNDFARIADATKLAVAGEGAFSMSGWFRMPAASTNNRGILDFSGNGGDGPQMLLTGANALNFRVDGSGTYNLVASIAGADVENDQWHFFAAVYDPSLETETLKLYLNSSTPAATASRGANAAAFVAPNPSCWLGSFNFTGIPESKGLDGMLDELAYYDGALTPPQIQQLFAKEISPQDLAPPPPPPFLISSYTRNPATGESTIVWDSVIGKTYYVQGCDDLESWIDLHFADGTGEALEFTHVPPGNPARYFYRVEAP